MGTVPLYLGAHPVYDRRPAHDHTSLGSPLRRQSLAGGQQAGRAADHGHPGGTPTLLTLAKDYVKRRFQKPGNVYLGVMSRWTPRSRAWCCWRGRPRRPHG